jgi:hypothetical protein
VLELVADALLLAPLQPDLVNEDHVIRLGDRKLVRLRRKCHLTNNVIFRALFCIYILNTSECLFFFSICMRSLTLSAGFVENLSFLTPFSSNITTILSVVHIARRLPLGAQQTAVTFTQPGFGCVRDSMYLSCIGLQLSVQF